LAALLFLFSFLFLFFGLALDLHDVWQELRPIVFVSEGVLAVDDEALVAVDNALSQESLEEVTVELRVAVFVQDGQAADGQSTLYDGIKGLVARADAVLAVREGTDSSLLLIKLWSGCYLLGEAARA